NRHNVPTQHVGVSRHRPSSVPDVWETECPTELRHRSDVVTLQVTRHFSENISARGRIHKARRPHLTRGGASHEELEHIFTSHNATETKHRDAHSLGNLPHHA